MDSAFPIELPLRYHKKAEGLHIVSVDLVESFIRGSGRGGQKLNKTSNCVWLRHVPTGIEVKVQKHREQSKNRLSAYKLLIDKIEESIQGAQSERAKQRFKVRKQKQRRTHRSKEKMLESKRQRSTVKALRKLPKTD